jgi:protein-L-isoaspartate(D-aspartate) O-methyltransferase
MIEDNFRHQGLRRQLVHSIREKGIDNEGVLDAIGSIPRHAFMDKAFLEYAYQDKAFPIAADQTISQPYTVAFQTQLLDLQAGMKVLEIGTGSGYQTAVLCKIGCKVFSIERHKVLHQRAQRILKELGFNPKLFFGDGFKGLPLFAPFDRILVTCGAAEVPETLLEQLKVGGKMVVPVGPRSEQVMTLILKNDLNEFSRSTHGVFRFVPMLRDKAN